MKAIFLTNIPAPHQVKFSEYLSKEVFFVFCNHITEDRPKYWNMDLFDNCIMLDQRKRMCFGKNRYINRDIFSVLKTINPDILVIGGFTIPTYLLAYWWARKNKKKIAVFTEISVHEKILNLYKILFSRIDAILAVGDKAVRQYKAFFPRISIYNFSYAADLKNRLSIKRNFDSEKVRFLYASRFIPNYNPIDLIQAFWRLSQKYNNIFLTMSSNGYLKEKCKELVELLDLYNLVTFRNDFKSWDDVNNLYAESDILVFPASFNSWGLVIPEAMASAMPVITTPYVIGSELLECNLVEPSIEGIYDAMEYYVLNRKEIRIQALKNRQLSASQSFENKSIQLRNILEKILSY